MSETNIETGKTPLNAPAIRGNYGRRKSDATISYHPVDEQSLITYNGKTGLFTPLAKEGEDDAISDKNLVDIIELLRKHIKELETENAELKVQVKQLSQKPPRTPDDFVTAISHSVDSLQNKLATMNNPTSNFVVRDFKIDTKVFIDVTPLGTVDYRFVQPGDKVDPNKLTNISLTLAPTPKPSGIGVYNGPDFTPFEDIDEIQGIGDTYKQRLNQHQVYTVSDLLHAGTRIRSKVELASLLEVEHNKLSEWMSHAELLTIKDIDGRMAEVLFDIGIRQLEQLALQSTDELVQHYNRQVAIMDHKVLKPIDEATAQRWIKAAQTYTGKKPEAPEAPHIPENDLPQTEEPIE